MVFPSKLCLEAQAIKGFCITLVSFVWLNFMMCILVTVFGVVIILFMIFVVYLPLLA